ncbi:hypothetical protein [Paenibacillus sp. N3.4]|nr:hypothetical protein [Paenibacillus sp. N3.4]
MKPTKGIISIEIIQIFLEGAEERLKFKLQLRTILSVWHGSSL